MQMRKQQYIYDESVMLRGIRNFYLHDAIERSEASRCTSYPSGHLSDATEENSFACVRTETDRDSYQEAFDSRKGVLD